MKRPIPYAAYTPAASPIFLANGISLAISTYQAGRVILIRNDNDQLNTQEVCHVFVTPYSYNVVVII